MSDEREGEHWRVAVDGTMRIFHHDVPPPPRPRYDESSISWPVPYEPREEVIRCPECEAERDFVVTGCVGGPPQLKCPVGHEWQLDDPDVARELFRHIVKQASRPESTEPSHAPLDRP
ncbi:hypothetical protein ACWD6P_10730 [Streptomyces sp. NPDC002446]